MRELKYVLSVVVESPSVVLFSMVRVETLVVERVSPPTDVMELAKTSPSASIMNLTEPFTAMPRMLVSAAAVAGLIYIEALLALAFEAPMAHAGKV